MADNKTVLAAGDGAAQYRKQLWRKDKFLLITIGLLALAVLSGDEAVSAFKAGTVGLWAPALCWIVIACIWGVYAWRFFAHFTDEFALRLNLIAHTIAVYVTFAVFGTWYMASRLSVIATPSAGAMMAVLIGAVFLSYGVLKLRARLG